MLQQSSILLSAGYLSYCHTRATRKDSHSCTPRATMSEYVHRTLADVKSSHSSHPSRVGHIPSSFPLSDPSLILHPFILSLLFIFSHCHDRHHGTLLGTHHSSLCLTPFVSTCPTSSYGHSFLYIYCPVSSTTIDNRSLPFAVLPGLTLWFSSGLTRSHSHPCRSLFPLNSQHFSSFCLTRSSILTTGRKW